MKITDGEKLIVAMLADLYDHLRVNGQVDHKMVRDAIHNGQSWAIETTHSGLFYEEQPEEIVKETGRLLDMWSLLERDFDALGSTEKAKYRTLTKFGDPRFEGFSANGGEHYGVAKFHITKLGHWPEFSKRSLDSHMPTIDADRRMYEAYRGLVDKRHSRSFTADELAEIMNARTHPDHR